MSPKTCYMCDEDLKKQLDEKEMAILSEKEKHLEAMKENIALGRELLESEKIKNLRLVEMKSITYELTMANDRLKEVQEENRNLKKKIYFLYLVSSAGLQILELKREEDLKIEIHGKKVKVLSDHCANSFIPPKKKKGYRKRHIIEITAWELFWEKSSILVVFRG